MTQLPVIQPADIAGERERQQIALDMHALGIGDVRFDRAQRMLYATDASMYQVEPVGVVVPRSASEAAMAVRYCADRRIAVLPRGGGTSLNGQCVNRAVVIDFSEHCRGITAVDAARRSCWVEPGVVNDQLNGALLKHGLMFGPDPATSSHNTVAGMIGNNSSGAHSIMYGRTVENVLALDVVLGTGTTHRLEEGACVRDPVQREIAAALHAILLPLRKEIRDRFPKILRHVDGYNFDIFLDQVDASTPGTFDRVNLAHLVCGSEGTLCTILGAELRLVESPKFKGLAIMGFADVDDALAGLSKMLATKPAAVELVDDIIIGLARANREYREYVELMPRARANADGTTAPLGAVMYVEYFGQSAAEVDAGLRALRECLPKQAMLLYTDAASMARAWLLRKAGEPLLHGIPGVRKPVGFVEDTAVDPARLPQFIHDFKAILAKYDTRASFYAHASVGCLHIRPLLDIRTGSGREHLLKIGEEVTDLVVRYHGALSGEHGSGRSRTALQKRYFGPEICAALAACKKLWDPHGLMNPGIKVDVSDDRMPVKALRIDPAGTPVEVPKVKTFFRYGDDAHGFAHAVELCNGAGMCRRMTGGTMCPSYRALLDERHATRGRGNHLRLAITGQLDANGVGKPAWNDPEVHETLRLCLSCKACKSECPSNVDIAKLKAEYQAQAYAVKGKVPLRTRVFGNVRSPLKWASRVAPLANALGRNALVRTMLEWTVGIDHRRSLPPVAPSLQRWLKRRAQPVSGGPTVLLFGDCFASCSEPRIGRAAVELLEAFGYRVVVPQTGCCGRPLISTGQLAEAIRVCSRTAGQLLDAKARTGAVALLVLEPSCLSAIKDDWLDLQLMEGRSAVAELAAGAFLAEEFLEKHWESHPKRPMAPAGPHEDVLLHGHCHQKALWGSESSAALLRRVLGDRLHVLPTGCCGMAGSFGFTTDRYDLSMQIGEQMLLPTVRSRPDAAVCAPGASCRHQIYDGTGREAVHPVELLASMLL